MYNIVTTLFVEKWYKGISFDNEDVKFKTVEKGGVGYHQVAEVLKLCIR